ISRCCRSRSWSSRCRCSSASTISFACPRDSSARLRSFSSAASRGARALNRSSMLYVRRSSACTSSSAATSEFTSSPPLSLPRPSKRLPSASAECVDFGRQLLLATHQRVLLRVVRKWDLAVDRIDLLPQLPLTQHGHTVLDDARRNIQPAHVDRELVEHRHRLLIEYGREDVETRIGSGNQLAKDLSQPRIPEAVEAHLLGHGLEVLSAVEQQANQLALGGQALRANRPPP